MEHWPDTPTPQHSNTPTLRVFLVLGRVSNLPTVWSNCLAAWLLGGGGAWEDFLWLCAGATFLYLSGTYLNDAFDVAFDRLYRPERPIPSGQISRRAVWVLASSFLLLGWFMLLPLGRMTAIFASVLVASIVFYSAIHKRTRLAPLLMSICRFVLYLTAAASAQQGAGTQTVWCALVLAGYILGLSCLAQRESQPGPVAGWPMGLLFAPAVVALAAKGWGAPAVWTLAAGQIVWVLWCLLGKEVGVRWRLSSGVAGLLGGIVMVDWLAATGLAPRVGIVFAGLFALALLLQRLAPAT